MKKTIISGISILCLLLVSWQKTPEVKKTDLSQLDQSDNYNILLDLDFNDSEDLHYLGEALFENADLVLEDGSVIIGINDIKSMGTSFSVHPGTGIYTRFKLDSGNTCITTNFGAGYEGCTGMVPGFEVMDHAMFDRNTDKHGDFVLPRDKWISLYSWIQQEEVERKTEFVSYNIIWLDEDPSNYMLTKGILPHTDSDRNMLPSKRPFMLSVWYGSIHVDALKVVRDDHMAFLADYVAGFNENAQDIKAFFDAPVNLTQYYVNQPGASQTSPQAEMNFSEFYTDVTQIAEAIQSETSREGVNFNWSVETNKYRTGLNLSVINRVDDDFWIRVNIENFPDASEENLENYIYQYSSVIIHPQAPKVGDLSYSFSAQPSEMFIFVKDGLMVEIFYPMVFRGNPQEITSEQMASIAAVIAECIPDKFILPEQIPVPDRWYEDMELFANDVSLNDNKHITLFFKHWVPSIQVITYYDLEDRIAKMTNITDMYKLGIGTHDIRIDDEYPNQSESAWLLVDGKILVTVSKYFGTVK